MTDKKKAQFFFQTAVVSILLYGFTTWTLTKHGEKVLRQLHKNAANCFEKVLEAAPYKRTAVRNLPSITKTIQVRRTRHAGYCGRNKDELMSDILLGIPSHGRGKVGRQAGTYVQQLCADTGCSLEDLSGAMDDRDRWWERIWKIRGSSATWWWFLSSTNPLYTYILFIHIY